MCVASGAACLEGQRLGKWDRRRIGVDREDVLPAQTKRRADDLTGKGNPRFERGTGRSLKLDGHELANRPGGLKVASSNARAHAIVFSSDRERGPGRFLGLLQREDLGDEL